jgi:hypothetical protein
MMLAVLISCLSAALADLLDGEWTISSQSQPSSSLYTIAFHRSEPRGKSLLNATLWRDDVPTSYKFRLSEEPLIAALQFSFSGSQQGTVISLFPKAETLCSFAFAGRGSELRAASMVDGIPITVTWKSRIFEITFGDFGSFLMTKEAEVEIVKSSKISSGPIGKVQEVVNVSQVLIWVQLALVLFFAQFIILKVFRACRSLVSRKTAKVKRPKKEAVQTKTKTE